ncbi:MAG: anti-phage ZorAB system protein ZorA [Flavobacteriaceae bacterium]|nr:anti-phage ZorAB system protein ZorA [Flavobacteriaceae bacterium]
MFDFKTLIFIVIPCIIILSFFICLLLKLCNLYKKEKENIDYLKGLILDWDKNESRKKNHFLIRKKLEKGKNKNDFLFKVWREFDESLVFHEEDIENTVDSHHFFNIHRLSPEVFYKEAFKVTPNILVGIGVLCTFIGLAYGLFYLKFDEDPDIVIQSIETIVKGASTAFCSSIIGILTSLIFLWIYSRYKSKLKSKILCIQNEIDFRYPKTNPEKSLVHIRDYAEEQKETLKNLNETIGNKLRDVIRGIREDLKSEIGNLSQSVNLFLEDLHNKAENRAEYYVGNLVDRFMEKLGSSIREQQKLIQETNYTIKEMLSDFNSQFLKQVDGLKEVIENLNESYHVVEDELVSKFSNATEQLEKGINQFLNYQNIIEQRFSQQDDILSNIQSVAIHFKEATENLIAAYGNLQKDYSQTMSSMEKLLNSLSEHSEGLSVASNQMSDLVETLKFPLKQLKDEFELMVSKMDMQFQKMSAYVDDMFTEVHSQTEKRMDEWNKHTYEFSSAMLGTVKEMDEKNKQNSEYSSAMLKTSKELNLFIDALKEEKHIVSKTQKNSIEIMALWTKESEILLSNTRSFSDDLVNIAKSLEKIIHQLDGVVKNKKKNRKK